MFVQELVANGTLQVTKVGTLSNPADIFTKFVSSETIQRQCMLLDYDARILYMRFMPLVVYRQIWLKFARQKAHGTRDFDFSKFLEAERPKYDVKTFGDPYQMAMKIVNDDEI